MNAASLPDVTVHRSFVHPGLYLVATVAVALLALAATPAALAGIITFPSSESIAPSGPVPAGGSPVLALNAATGEQEAGQIVVSGAKSVAATIDRTGLGGVQARLAFAHFVAFGAKHVPDALLPWDGAHRPTEAENQPLYVILDVPYGAVAGFYSAIVTVTADDVATPVKVTLQLFPVTLPEPNAAAGNLLTSFHLSAETYINAVGRINNSTSPAQFQATQAALYSFLSSWRISPDSYGYGEPKSTAGYTSSPKWWLDAAGNAIQVLGAQPGFSALRVPVSSNRASVRNRIAGLDPTDPEGWCGYLQAVYGFWSDHGWLAGRVPYLYAQDEPGPEGMRLVARQAKALHGCFPGAQALVTGNPSPIGANSFLWTAKDGSNVDIWAVLANRYYGKYTVPVETKDGVDRSRQKLRAIEDVRKAGAKVWAYNYAYAGNATPGYGASEPLSSARMLELWAALEGIQGVLYPEGMASYRAAVDPLQSVGQDGRAVLIYPAAGAPIPSARLLQIRDGIEDWAIYDLVRRKQGAARVRTILGASGLFSADAKGVRLGCTVGCALKTATPFSWPQFSSDATTPRRIEAAKLQALQAASG
jgi:hypothetical protein